MNIIKPIKIELYKELQKLGYIKYGNSRNYTKTKRYRFVEHDDFIPEKIEELKREIERANSKNEVERLEKQIELLKKVNMLDEYKEIVAHL